MLILKVYQGLENGKLLLYDKPIPNLSDLGQPPSAKPFL